MDKETYEATKGDRGYFTSQFWAILRSIEFEDVTGEIIHESKRGPTADFSAEITFNKHLRKVVRQKQDYLEAARQEEISDDELVTAVAEDILTAFEIVFSSVGVNYPEEGVYEKINQNQWKKVDADSLYPQYREILWDVTDEVSKSGVPSIPQLYRPFLFEVSQSETHTLPPEGTVEDILREHISSVRSEQQSREGVSKLKRELESRGVQPRTAASVAKSMEEYLKSDSKVNSIQDGK